MAEESSWSADRPLTDSVAAAVIAEQFPELAPVHVTARYEGWDNQAIEASGAWIFRFPKRFGGEVHLRKEIALLPHVASRLSIPIPTYRFFGTPSVRFPYHFAGYAKLSGVPAITFKLEQIEPLTLIDCLAETLSRLHQIPVEEAVALGVPFADDGADMLTEAEEELEEIRVALKPATYDLCRNFLHTNAGFRRPLAGDRFLHSDFSPEHILLTPDGRQVAGLIDWTDAEIGDPAFDFSYLWVWQGEAFVEMLLQQYTGETDSGFLSRVRLYGICSAIADLHYGILAERDHNRRVGLRALERFAIEVKP